MDNDVTQTDGGVVSITLEDGQARSYARPLEDGQSPRSEWDFSDDEGKLSVDVAQDGDSIIVIAAMAGTQTDRIEVFVQGDLLTIRGFRVSPLSERRDVEFFYQECFWGVFSRTVVLPREVHGHRAHAEYRNGILTVHIPKRGGDARVPIIIVDE